ncbi:uncharacterized protein TNCV_2889361 [Trichonephila clavipes]|nr:uncharacterized protein TNCV_2889361 [Trichonephila clavipes]
MGAALTFLEAYDRYEDSLLDRIVTGDETWVFSHPPYSPDLAPSDFHLFPRMKNWLATQRFDNDKELRVRVTEWLRSQVEEFYDKGISKLIHRYDKCLNLFGDYLEK